MIDLIDKEIMVLGYWQKMTHLPFLEAVDVKCPQLRLTTVLAL